MNNIHLPRDAGVNAATSVPTNEQVSQAIQWLVQFEAGSMDNAARQGFERWLKENPQHQLAWQRLGKANQYFSYNDLAAGSAGKHRAALSADMALQSIQQSDAGIEQKRRSLKILACVTGAGLIGWLSRDYTGLDQHAYKAYHSMAADLQTEVGKQHQHTLDDGSTLMLNTHTAVDIDLQARPHIHLLYGELSLAIQNRVQPLQLRAHGHLFTPEANSEFTLYKHDQVCQLNVVAGAVQSLLAQGKHYNVLAGQSLFYSEAGVNIGQLDRHQLSWRQGLLTAERQQLGVFLQQLTRYRPGYLGCADEVAQLSLSGSFPINNTELILDNLCQILPIRQQRFSRYWVRLLPA